MSENENTVEETAAADDQAAETTTAETSAPAEASKSEASNAEASSDDNQTASREQATNSRSGSQSNNRRFNDRRDDRRGGRDDRRGGRSSRFGNRDDRREVSNVYTGGAPAEYVRPQYRGRSRRVEGSINIKDVHYRNIPLLSKFLDPYGRIMSRRKTRVSAKVQRKAVKAIKQARHLCLLPYTGEHMRVARRRRRR